MPIEIEGIRGRRGWTSTSAIATHKAPFAGLGVIRPSPTKKTDGLKVSIRVESNRRIPMSEFNILFLPALEAQGLEVVGRPKLIVEDSPIWVWRKYMYGDREDIVYADPQARKEPTYIATLAAGPLKGYESDWRAPVTCLYKGEWEKPEMLKCRIGAPTAKDTAELARVVEEWSVYLRRKNPAENLDTKLREANKALSEPLEKLEVFTRQYPVSAVVKAEVAAPKAKAGIGGTAAIIGLALAMLTWGLRKDR